MTTWSQKDLDAIGDADEVELATQRTQGALSPYVTVWIVRAGDGLYIRSANGRNGSWFRRAIAAGKARFRMAGTERDVVITEPMSGLEAQLNDTYRSKYRRYGARFVDMMVAEPAVAATVQLLAQEGEA